MGKKKKNYAETDFDVDGDPIIEPLEEFPAEEDTFVASEPAGICKCESVIWDEKWLGIVPRYQNGICPKCNKKWKRVATKDGWKFVERGE